MDVARESGFSASTVSIVLNDAPLSRYVAVKTKQHIREVAKRMGYRPDAFARSLRSRRSRTIGIMVFDLSDPYCTLILKGIQRSLYTTSYLPFIMDAHNQAQQFERYLEMLLERRVEGLIVVANWLFIDIRPLADLARQQIPTMLIGREMRSSPISSVMVDNKIGGYDAMRHLYELGHREIAIIRGPEQLVDSQPRWEGIVQFCSEVGLKLNPAHIVDLSDTSDPNSGFEEGYRFTKMLAGQKEQFSALVAFDDLTAFGAIRALHEAGREIPSDCSVIGFDDVPHAAHSSPGLTTVRQPMEQMGEIAANYILKAIDAVRGQVELPSEAILMPPAVVVRESTAAYRQPVLS
jgi:LacI family transcriptional regulator